MWYYSNNALADFFINEYERNELYDVLHTQGDGWLMEDINEFLKIRGMINLVLSRIKIKSPNKIIIGDFLYNIHFYKIIFIIYLRMNSDNF